MTVAEFYNKLCELYPPELSCEWDNDGLMVCPDKSTEIKKVLVSLDPTEGAIEAAKACGAQLIFTHHPIIFRPIKSLSSDNVTSFRAISAYISGISVISLHTRLDAGTGGVNDTLASRLGLTDTVKFGNSESPELGRIGNTDTTTLADFADKVRNALGAPHVTFVGNVPVRRVAVVGGDGNDFVSAAMSAGADTIVTGEARYNMFVDMAESGINVITAGHYFTENPVCGVLSSLAKDIAGAEVTVYSSNTVKMI